jgi:seryl-tRNA synthetase
VLVSLLAILLVPLVVVYAHNEDSFKAKYETSSAQAAAANQNFHNAQLAHSQSEADLELQIRELMSTNEALARERESAAADIRRLEIELAEAHSSQAGIRADINTISSAVAAGQDINDSLLTEVRTMRSESLSAERRAVELDEALREISGQLESAVAARRAMQEELQQIKEEHALALQQVAAYVEKWGRMDILIAASTTPNVDLDATVVSVRRGSEQTLAEINAGSRDGVQEVFWGTCESSRWTSTGPRAWWSWRMPTAGVVWRRATASSPAGPAEPTDSRKPR